MPFMPTCPITEGGVNRADARAKRDKPDCVEAQMAWRTLPWRAANNEALEREPSGKDVKKPDQQKKRKKEKK